jgi:uncharacterized tellurite resistance protein B-like protein
MTPVEKTIVKSLVAVAWADGSLAEPESGMIDSLLWAFGASDEDETEIREFAKKKRTIKGDIVAKALDQPGRELLLSHAALLTHADGKQTPAEAKLLKTLAEHLEFSDADAARVIATAKERAKKLASPESSTGGSAGTGVGCRSRRARAIFHAIGASASALLHALGLSGHGPAHGSRRPATPWAQLCPRSALERDHGIADW